MLFIQATCAVEHAARGVEGREGRHVNAHYTGQSLCHSVHSHTLVTEFRNKASPTCLKQQVLIEPGGEWEGKCPGGSALGARQHLPFGRNSVVCMARAKGHARCISQTTVPTEGWKVVQNTSQCLVLLLSFVSPRKGIAFWRTD